MVTNESEMTMKKLHSNNSGEYIDSQLQKFLDEQGIIHQPAAPYTLKHNGVAERKNQTLVEKARCILQHAKLSYKFWAEAMTLATHITNRVSIKSLDRMTPEEA